LIGYVFVLGVGYVLGTKAGRRRYEQLAGTYRALTSSPVAKSMIEGGRRKIANRISPDAGFVTLTEIDDQTSIVERPVERPAERPVDRTAERPFERPVERRMQHSVEQQAKTAN
jgi:hypothetical protein